ALLADGVAQKQIKDRPRLVTQFAITMDRGASAELILVADRSLRLLEQARSVLRLDLLQVLRRGIRVLVLVGDLAGSVVSSDDQAGNDVARVAHLGNVPPGVR